VQPHRDAEAGRVVALDRTANLLAGTASTMLRFKTDDALPATVAARARVTGRVAQVTARDAGEVESSRGCARRRQGRRPRDRPRRTWKTCSSRSCRRKRLELDFEGTERWFNKEVLRFWKVSVQTVAAGC